MSSTEKVPAKTLLRYFELATKRLLSLSHENHTDATEAESTPVTLPSDPTLDWHRNRVMGVQLSSLNDAVSFGMHAGRPSVDRETVQGVLRDIGVGDFASVDFGDAFNNHGEDKQQTLLVNAMEQTNEAARVAFFLSVILTERSLDVSNARSARTLRDDNLDRSSILEYCGLMMTAVRLPQMQSFLQNGEEELLFGNATKSLGANYGLSVGDRLKYVQTLCLRAVGWESKALPELENLFSESCNHEILNDATIVETLTKYASAMTVAATNADMEASAKNSTDDGTTRIVNVSYSEKIVTIPQSTMETSNQNIRSLSAPTSNTMDEHMNNRQRQEMEIAQKTAMLQQQLWNNFLSLSSDDQKKTLEKAKLAQDEFLESISKTPPGPERVMLMQNMDGEVQKLLVIYKLWCSKEGVVSGSG